MRASYQLLMMLSRCDSVPSTQPLPSWRRTPSWSALCNVLSILFMASVATAADQKSNPQQERMKACNAEAGEKKLAGNDRRAFTSTCLKGQTPAPMTRQEKMKVCNKEAVSDSRSSQGD